MNANREGFHLSEVSNARLAQRRLRKQRVRSDDSGYLSSTATAAGSGSTSPSNLITGPSAPGGPSAHFLAPVGEPPHPPVGAGVDPNWNQRKRKLFPLEEERQSMLGTYPSTNTNQGRQADPSQSSSNNTSYTSCASGGASNPASDVEEGNNPKYMATEAVVRGGAGVKGGAGDDEAEPIMKESFSRYRETPEANRDSIDFCSFKNDVPPPPKSAGKKAPPPFEAPPKESGSSSGGEEEKRS